MNEIMKTTATDQLRAWGRYKPPDQITVRGLTYRRKKIFKHDFFALTALFELKNDINLGNKKAPAKVVLKLGRRRNFLGLPLDWLGRALCRHEISILKRLQHLSQVPRLLGLHSNIGFIYEYIEGCSLDEEPSLPDDFFDRLEDLVKRIHACRVGYVDMNKRGNILLGHDNLPYLIDFQISYHVSCPPWPLRKPADSILNALQREDFYHLFKHKRRLCRHLMDDLQMMKSQRKSRLILAHRIVARPLTRLRRKILSFLFRSGHLVMDDITVNTPENDPSRWEK
jgi:predicted Ser/Thr protein kinase